MDKISVIIPAHNEKAFLNQTIDNFYRTAREDIEVIVVLNGYDQEVDKRAIVFKYKENMGERVAMNTAASLATGKYLFRIDGHCSIEPEGWDIKLKASMKPNRIVVTALTAIDRSWNKIPGHWYGFCQLLPTMEEKWLSKDNYGVLEKNMAFTGCGMLIEKEFYDSFKGADESLAAMGAIGPEFALRGWLNGSGCYTRTDVLIGHIFDTGGYGLKPVEDARKKLQQKYGKRYNELLKHFPETKGVTMENTSSVDQKKRTVIVSRQDEHVVRDSSTGAVIKKIIEHFKYVHEDDGEGLTEKEIESKYAPMAKKVGEDVYYPDQNGKLVLV